MKLATTLSLAFIATALLCSCSKLRENSLEGEQRAAQFRSFIVSKKFQVKDFYSDKPIDYIEDDGEVRSETELFKYVSSWIKDDWNIFEVSTGKVNITQNAVKISGDDSEILVRNFNIGSDNAGVYFDFLTYRYEPLRYRLVEFTDNHFIVYVNWKSGAKLFTKFAVVE